MIDLETPLYRRWIYLYNRVAERTMNNKFYLQQRLNITGSFFVSDELQCMLLCIEIKNDTRQ